MEKISEQLKNLVKEYAGKLSALSEDEFSQKPFPEKWSRKEELGHLIDSAHNNLRRFVVGQYEAQPKITYNQNFWVNAFNYQHQSSADLIATWKLLNFQVAEVLNQMPEKNFNLSCDTGKEIIELRTLVWLAEDYIRHLKHHLHHILELEAIPY